MVTELPSFETLRHLAENDPEQLERLRTELTEQLIAGAPARLQQRLRGLQFQIDARVRLASNPVAACVAVSAMMHDQLEQLRQALNGELPVPAGPAEVVPLAARTLH
jgi:hypothetical protein